MLAYASPMNRVSSDSLPRPALIAFASRRDWVLTSALLAMANSALVKTQSRRLAKAISAGLGSESDDTRFIGEAYASILSRPPTPDETEACREFLREQSALLAEPGRLTAATVGDVSKTPPATEPGARAKENLVLVLFNHNDFISIR